MQPFVFYFRGTMVRGSDFGTRKKGLKYSRIKLTSYLCIRKRPITFTPGKSPFRKKPDNRSSPVKGSSRRKLDLSISEDTCSNVGNNKEYDDIKELTYQKHSELCSELYQDEEYEDTEESLAKQTNADNTHQELIASDDTCTDVGNDKEYDDIQELTYQKYSELNTHQELIALFPKVINGFQVY